MDSFAHDHDWTAVISMTLSIVLDKRLATNISYLLKEIYLLNLLLAKTLEIVFKSIKPSI